jgi:hypothetical protein
VGCLDRGLGTCARRVLRRRSQCRQNPRRPVAPPSAAVVPQGATHPREARPRPSGSGNGTRADASQWFHLARDGLESRSGCRNERTRCSVFDGLRLAQGPDAAKPGGHRRTPRRGGPKRSRSAPSWTRTCARSAPWTCSPGSGPRAGSPPGGEPWGSTRRCNRLSSELAGDRCGPDGGWERLPPWV